MGKPKGKKQKKKKVLQLITHETRLLALLSDGRILELVKDEWVDSVPPIPVDGVEKDEDEVEE